jgi:hypothetical protein
MRNILLCLLICFFLASTSYAAPCYGTKMPQKKKIFLGLQTYSVLERQLEQEHGKVRSLQNFLLISLGIFDWFSLDLKGGAGNVRQRPDVGHRINYHTYLGGGYGARLRLYDRNKTKMVLGFQHISIHPLTACVDISKYKVVLDDWQYSFLVSHDFFKITPYIGTRWSRMDKITWIDGTRKLEKSDLDKSIGLIIGTDMPLSKKLWFNIETQFLDATAIAASLNCAF